MCAAPRKRRGNAPTETTTTPRHLDAKPSYSSLNRVPLCAGSGSGSFLPSRSQHDVVRDDAAAGRLSPSLLVSTSRNETASPNRILWFGKESPESLESPVSTRAARHARRGAHTEYAHAHTEPANALAHKRTPAAGAHYFDVPTQDCVRSLLLACALLRTTARPYQDQPRSSVFLANLAYTLVVFPRPAVSLRLVARLLLHPNQENLTAIRPLKLETDSKKDKNSQQKRVGIESNRSVHRKSVEGTVTSTPLQFVVLRPFSPRLPPSPQALFSHSFRRLPACALCVLPP